MMLAFIVTVVIGGMRLYWKMRADNGFNMGRNYMHDLGFSDDDINRGQDDADAEFFVFRKKQEKSSNPSDSGKEKK